MSVFRSYFSKNNTLIEDNLSNNSQNPVTEIAYGTVNSEVTRFIFDINLEPLQERISQGVINPATIQRHVLHMTNTIAFDPEYLGKKTYDLITDRASSFNLELFNIDEEWDEGSGYEFFYNDEDYILYSTGASNWYDRTTTSGWTADGAYISGTSAILGQQRFEKGNENIEIDITDYVNAKLGSINTGLTGLTASTGIGIKYTDEFEGLETLYRQAVAFFARKTNTFYEPFIETIYNDTIEDDRNYFFLDKTNALYLYANVGANPQNITVNSVEILDYMGQSVMTFGPTQIENVRLGVYKILVNINSATYPDAVLFTDRWNVTVNGVVKDIDQEFFLISQDSFFNFDLGNRINFDNYSFNYYGITQGERVKDNNIRRIGVDVKQLYPNQDNNLPLNVEYRLYNSQNTNHQTDVIPWTKVNRTFKGFEFNIDMGWLIPQDYTLELRLVNGNTYMVKEPLHFTVVSEAITTPSTFRLSGTTTTTTTTTLPPTTTTTTTTMPPTTTTTTTTSTTTTTTTTTMAINPPIFIAFNPVLENGTFTNTNDTAGNGDEYELLWTTDFDNTQKFDLAMGGAPLIFDTTLNITWQSSGDSFFELTTFTGVTTGGTGATVLSNGSLNIGLSSGDTKGYIRFTVNNSGVTNAGFEINVNTVPDPVQRLATPADATDPRFVLRENNTVDPTNATIYGYTELTNSDTTVFMVSVI